MVKKSNKNKKQIVSLTQNALNKKIIQYVENSSESTTVEKGNRFCEWVLKYIFERTDDEIIDDTIISGTGDNSIDAYFEENDVLYIIQTKYNTSHSWSGATTFFTDLNRLLLNPYDVVGSNKELITFSSILENYLNKEKKIKLYYITNNTFTNEMYEKSKKLKEVTEKNYKNVNCECLSIKEIYELILISLKELPSHYKEKPRKLLLENFFIANDTCVAQVALKNFAEFVDKSKEYLFYSNVRSYLKNTGINNQIKETFNKTPTDFWYYNNGVTIICDDFEEPNTAHAIPIYAPQIVNGCQTSNSILERYSRLTPEEKTNKQGCLLVKIIKDKNKKRTNNIIKYTNNQNSVSAMDFFALETFHQDLKIQFQGLGYYYEIQRKESEFKKSLNKTQFRSLYGKKEHNKIYSYLFKKGFKYIIPVKQVIQSYAAGMHLMTAVATGRIGNLAPGKDTNAKLFNDKTPKDPLYFLFSYGTAQYAKCYLEYGNNNGKNKNKMEDNNQIDDLLLRRKKRKNSSYKKSCLMLYVSTYYRMLVRFLKKVERYNNNENDNPLKIKLEILKSIFENKTLNVMLLNTADKIVDNYINDTKVQEMYNDNLPKFLKADVDKQLSISILNDKIDTTFDEKLTDEEYEMFVKHIQQFPKCN